MAQDIRIRFSGVVIFVAKIASIATGLVVTVLIARSFSLGEFGAWTNLTNVLATLTIPATSFPFWSTRFYARGFHDALTLGVVINGFLSVIMAIIALVIGPTLARAAGTLSLYYAFVSTIIIVSYTVSALEGVVSIRATHVIAYGVLTYELIRTSTIVLLVAEFHLGIGGALAALFLANCAWISIYAWTLRDRFTKKVPFSYLRQWIKGSFLNLYAAGAGIVGSFENFILLFFGGNLALGYFGAATSVAGPIGTTVALSYALYPKLLTGGNEEDVALALRLNFLFSIPFTISVIALSPSLLAILSSTTNYIPATMILAILAVRGFLFAAGGVFDAVLSGTARFDETGFVSLRGMIRSRLFIGPTIAFVISAIYLSALWVVLHDHPQSPIASATALAELGFGATLAFISLKGIVARRFIRIDFQLSSAAKYLVVALAIAAVALILPQPLPYPVTIALFAAGTAAYLGILYLVDDEAHLLVSAMIEKLRSLWRVIGC